MIVKHIEKSDTPAPFSLWLKISFIILALIKIWLVSGQTLSALDHSIYDDQLFLNLAANLLSGDWLGEYNKITLAKGPFYPIWIALTFISGIPLLLSQHLLYIVSCIVFLVAVRPILPKSTALLIAVYTIMLFNPMTFSFSIGDKVFRQSIYLTLTVFVAAASIGFLIRYTHSLKNLAFWSTGLGFALSAFWLTREEGIWIMPSILMIIGFTAIRIWQTQSPDWFRRLFLCILPFGILLFSIGTVAGINKIYYGVFATVEFKSADFLSAYGALTRVKHAVWHPQVQVPRETRERIYKISPAFGELKPFLEGDLGRQWEESSKRLSYNDRNYLANDDIHGGFFLWAFRDAVDAAGYHKTPSLAMSYYKRLAAEINTACKEHKIDCGPKRASLAPPWNSKYMKPLLKDIVYTASYVVRFEDFYADPPPSIGTAKELKLFQDITREDISPPEYLHIKGWAFQPTGMIRDIKFSARDPYGNISDASIVLNSGEDVYQHFLNEGKNFPNAHNSRFDITTPCITGCYLQIESSDSLTEKIPLDGSIKHLETPLYFYMDSLERERDVLSHQSKLDNLKVKVLWKFGTIYQIVVPFLIVLAVMTYVIITVQIFRKRTITKLWIINTAILIAIMNMLFIISFIDISSFPAVKPWYLSATYPLLLMFSVLAFLAPATNKFHDKSYNGD